MMILGIRQRTKSSSGKRVALKMFCKNETGQSPVVPFLYFPFGSKISLNPLPRKLNARIVKKIARAGKRMVCG